MQDDAVELVDCEQPMAAHGAVLRGHRLQRNPRQVAGEDDVHNMLRREAPHRRDRVDDRDGALDRDVVVDPDLLGELTVQGIDQTLAGVHPSARQEPVLAPRLLVSAEQHAPPPPQDRRDADPWFHQCAEEPKPRTPRSLSGSSSTSSSSNSGTGTTTSCAMRIPRSMTNASAASVFSRMMRSSPR